VSRVTIAPEALQVPPSMLPTLPPKREHLNSRIAFLRKIHSHLLEGAEDTDVVEKSESIPISTTEENSRNPSLCQPIPCGELRLTESVLQLQGVDRKADEADIIAAVSDLWRHKHSGAGPPPSDAGPTFEEVRFRQMQEAEAVKRALARKNCPFSAAAVDQALIIPQHKFVATGTLFNEVPHLLQHPFPEDVHRKRQKSTSRPSTRRTRVSARQSS